VSERQRIDKWLWHARVVKTRTLAAGLVGGGHVRINRIRVTKPSQPVQPGDVLTVAVRDRIVVLRVEAIGARRGPASEAQSLFTDLSPPVQAEPAIAPTAARPRGSGRPTKRERRQIDAWADSPNAPDEEGR
jgi:ribosome-associated heat shock protein Hsp15